MRTAHIEGCLLVEDYITVFEKAAPDIDFSYLWSLRPDEPQTLFLPSGNFTPGRRWLAMGKDYRFSGQVASAVPFVPVIDNLRQEVENLTHYKFNGALLNFYGENDSISHHQDDQRDLVRGSPIVTVSYGTPRVFSLEEIDARRVGDVIVKARDVLVMHPKAAAKCTHAILPYPRSHKNRDSRISVTFRNYK